MIKLVRNTDKQFPVSESTKLLHGEQSLEVVEFNPKHENGATVFSMYSNAMSLPYVKLLKKPAQGKHAARYLDCIVSNGVHMARVSLSDIGAVAGVSQSDRDVLGELLETCISMCTTSTPSRPQVTNGFTIEAISDSYFSF